MHGDIFLRRLGRLNVGCDHPRPPSLLAARPRLQIDLEHLDQEIGIKAPAIDNVAIGRDDTVGRHAKTVRNDRAARPEEVEHVKCTFALPPDEGPVVARKADDSFAIVAHIERGEALATIGPDGLDAASGGPDPGEMAAISVVSAHDGVAIGADCLGLAIE